MVEPVVEERFVEVGRKDLEFLGRGGVDGD